MPVAIPDYQTLMLPLLCALSNGQPRHVRELSSILGEEFSLSDEELSQLTPGGGSLLFHGRVSWAKTYISQAGLVEQVSRGVSPVLRIVGGRSAGRHGVWWLAR